MKDNNYLIRIASFLIFLIIALPMNGSLAVAATIHSADAFGRAEIPGFRAMTDITVVNVTATITEDSDIGPGQVKILEDPTVPFECSVLDEATALFGCKAELAEVPLPASTGLLPFTVQIFADNGAPLSPPRQGSLLVDAKPPKIIGDPVYAALPGGIVEASYEVIDEACDAPACAQRCTGVARIGFSVASLNVGEGIIESNDCRQTGKVNLTGLIAGADVQTKHICVEAVDRLGQSSSKCKDVLIDTKPPFISSVGLYDINSRQIIYTNGQQVCNVKIIVNLTEDSVLVNPRVISAPMDLILLNASLLSERPDHQALYGNLQAACTKKSTNTYECKNDVGACLIVTSARDVSIRVEAADQFGNIVNESKSLSISFDNTAPVATKIYTNFTDDKGISWIRAVNNTISMDITEANSGMNNRYAFIDLSGFGPQIITTTPTLVPPHECVPGWTCRWH
ncbi:hypothetical protein HZB90_04755, partial [archaeon]|nr:hypothetical protein [archaeon]